MACSDPYITYLKQYGYNVVRLPKTDVHPGQLLTRNGNNLARLGDLTDVLAAPAPALPPPLIADQAAANLSGRQSGELSIGIGLTLLGTIIGALGGSKLGLDLKYERARTAVFEFDGVLEDRIEVAALDAFLSQADVKPHSGYVSELLFADHVYVITSTIKSRRFTVETKDAAKHGVEVSVPEIQQAVGGTVKVSGQSERTAKVTYEGTVPLVFGFQAVQLDYEGGRYRRFKPVDAGGVSLEAVAPPGRDARSAGWLTTPAAFVNV